MSHILGVHTQLKLTNHLFIVSELIDEFEDCSYTSGPQKRPTSYLQNHMV
jgi:hypothetical protein